MTGTAPILEPPQPKTKTTAKRKRRIAWGRFCYVAIVILVIAVAAFFGYTGATPAEALKFFRLGVDIVRAKAIDAPPFHGQQQVNIMLLGTDVSTDPSGEDCRTDSIKIVSADFAKSTLAILSVPRDTWVEIPGHGHSRINSAYPLGGKKEADRISMSKLVISRLLSDLYGQPVHLDKYIRLQTGGFDRIINAMGGVDVDVEKQMDYDDPSQLLSIHLKPGLQHLDGHAAEGYIRFRHDAEGDYTRMQRQDKFIRTLAGKLHSMDKMQMARLIGPVMGLMYTNINGSDMLALKELADKVGMSGIQTAQLPTVPTMKGAAAVVEVRDTAAAAQVISEILNGPRPTVTVLNGSGQTGVARTVSEQIDIKQYNVLAVGTTLQPVATTSVIASDRYKTAAINLATRLGVQTVATVGTVPTATFGKHAAPPPPTDITIVLGSNYTGVLQTAANDAAPAATPVADGK